MSIQYNELIDPRQEFLDRGFQLPAPAEEKDDPHILLIAMGIAAAIIGIKMIMSHRLAKENPQTPDEARDIAEKLWAANKAMWRKLATPSVVDAYKYGSGTLFIPENQLEKLAILYVDEMGDYFKETSINALADGFSAQLNSGWAKDLAWKRSTPAFGLDAKQTRSYVITLTDQPKGRFEPEPVPAQAARAIDKAMLTRADRIGINEAYKAKQVGRNTVWMYMEKHGDILPGAQKKWITAQDELVCPVCAPLNGVSIPLGEQFSSNGSRFYAPGVHPNCRCELVLVPSIDIVKNMPGDPYDRDKSGRFAATELRQANRERLPIGQYRAPIGSSFVPIGQMSGPIGTSLAPIGQDLLPLGFTPIGTDTTPIGVAPELPPIKLRDKPKIGNKPETKVKTKTKVTTKINNAAKTKVENASGIKSATAIPTEHKGPLLVPANEFIAELSMNQKRLFEKINGMNPVISLGGYIGYAVDINNPEKYEQEIHEAFEHAGNMQIPGEIESSYISINPVLARARASRLRGEVDRATNSPTAIFGSATSAGISRSAFKNPMVFFVLDGWNGANLDVLASEDKSVGNPMGQYEVDVDNIKVEKKPPSIVKDYIDSGIGAVSNASPLTDGYIYIPIRAVSGPNADQIVKRSRLHLKRK